MSSSLSDVGAPQSTLEPTPAAPEPAVTDPGVPPVPRAVAAVEPARTSSPAGVRGPAEALAELMAGNLRFISREPIHGHDVTAAAATASGDQQPYAVVIGCIDSRVPLEAIFDQTFGSICVVRSGAHVLDSAVLGSVEFAVSALRVPLIVVLGHERCGAVAATVSAVRTGQRPGGSLTYLVDQIAPAVEEVGVDHPQVHAQATRRHVTRTVGALAAQPELAAAVNAGEVDIAGAIYDLASGRVELLS